MTDGEALKEAVRQSRREIERLEAQLDITEYFDTDKLDYHIIDKFIAVRARLAAINEDLYGETS